MCIVVFILTSLNMQPGWVDLLHCKIKKNYPINNENYRCIGVHLQMVRNKCASENPIYPYTRYRRWIDRRTCWNQHTHKLRLRGYQQLPHHIKWTCMQTRWNKYFTRKYAKLYTIATCTCTKTNARFDLEPQRQIIIALSIMKYKTWNTIKY